MTISVHCNSVKMSREGNQSLGKHLPVFGDHDRVRGTISLDPSLNLSTGRLVVFVSLRCTLTSRRVTIDHSYSVDRRRFLVQVV